MATIAFAVPVSAQDIPRGETVKSRPKPELDPNGIAVGSFRAFPKVSVTETYDDNIMAKDTDEKSDFITVLGAGAKVDSDWTVHSVKIAADVKAGRYWKSSAEDYEDFSLTADGRYEYSKDLSFTGKIAAAFGHEPRSSTDDSGGFSPGTKRDYTLEAGFEKKLNKVSFKGGIDAKKFDHDDVQGSTGITNHDDRDRIHSSAHLRVGYQATPEFEGYGRFEVNKRDYRFAVDDNGVNRDSQGYQMTGGLSFAITGITDGDVFLGYRSQTIDDPDLKKAKGPSGGLDITWNASKITTVIGSIEHTLEETTTAGASGKNDTKSSISVDHELLRNLILSSKVEYTNSSFVGIDRKDNDLKYVLGMNYRLFRNLTADVEYTYTNRQSNAEDSDYNKNAIMLRLTGQL